MQGSRQKILRKMSQNGNNKRICFENQFHFRQVNYWLNEFYLIKKPHMITVHSRKPQPLCAAVGMIIAWNTVKEARLYQQKGKLITRGGSQALNQRLSVYVCSTT